MLAARCRLACVAGALPPPRDAPEPAPRRITGRVGGLSVGRQRELLKQLRQDQEVPARPQPVRRANRAVQSVQSASTAVELAVARDARERELARVRKERRLEEEAQQRSALKSGVLLVDAYNVIHEWPMCAELLVAGDLAGARDALLHELQGYAAFRGMKVIVVFDASTSLQKEAQRDKLSDQLEVVFSAGGNGTADEFIESEVKALLQVKEPPLVYVATSDRVSGDVSAGGGAVVISSKQLIRYIMKSDAEAKEVLRVNRARSVAKEGRRVIARLDAGTSSSLLALRNKLNEEAKRQAR